MNNVMDSFRQLVDGAGWLLDAAGVLVVLVGVAIASVLFASRARQQSAHPNYRQYRQNLGRSILLGLELLVAGDIIRTVAIEPTLKRVLVLALIVLIRTFLSFSLQLELEGRWPWRTAPVNHDPQAGA